MFLDEIKIAEIMPCLADPDRVERALVNLVTNALKYSPAELPVTVRITRDGPRGMVSVVDRGVGIPAEDIPRLFNRFSRASTATGVEGLGLGLFITRLIVEAHGGRIWCESEPGKGSAFYFTLPLA